MSLNPIGVARTSLRRNRFLHKRWVRIKRSPFVHEQMRVRALKRNEAGPAESIKADRATAAKVLESVNKVMRANTAMDGHWHVYGGALIGWAREGQLLGHDLKDIDLAIDENNLPEMVEIIDALVGEGFTIPHVFVSNDGSVREVALERQEVRIDLFVFRDVFGFWDNRGYGTVHGHSSELISYLPRQPLETIELSGLPWPKVCDHDCELTAIYGDWRTPDPTWLFGDDHSLVAVSDWKMGHIDVIGGVHALRAQAATMREQRTTN
jgi:hypothetical protein